MSDEVTEELMRAYGDLGGRALAQALARIASLEAEVLRLQAVLEAVRGVGFARWGVAVALQVVETRGPRAFDEVDPLPVAASMLATEVRRVLGTLDALDEAGSRPGASRARSAGAQDLGIEGFLPG